MKIAYEVDGVVKTGVFLNDVDFDYVDISDVELPVVDSAAVGAYTLYPAAPAI